MTSNDFYEKNSEINIKDLFQQVKDQTICKRLTKEVFK